MSVRPFYWSVRRELWEHRSVTLVPIAVAIFERDQKLIEHHFAQRVRSAMPPRDQPHRPIAVAGERGLHDGEADLQRADAQLRQRRGDGGDWLFGHGTRRPGDKETECNGSLHLSRRGSKKSADTR